MEKILLFQCKEAEKVRQIAGKRRIKTEVIETEFFRESIGTLERGRPKMPKESFSGEPPKGSLLVFCGVTKKHFDAVLADLKKGEIEIDYKAVMTPTNRMWSVLRLYMELEREKSGI